MLPFGLMGASCWDHSLALATVRNGAAHLANHAGGGFRGFSRFFELFSNICFFGKVPRLRANSVDNASARRIDPRYPEVQISISIFLKFSIFDRYFLAKPPILGGDPLIFMKIPRPPSPPGPGRTQAQGPGRTQAQGPGRTQAQ